MTSQAGGDRPLRVSAGRPGTSPSAVPGLLVALLWVLAVLGVFLLPLLIGVGSTLLELFASGLGGDVFTRGDIGPRLGGLWLGMTIQAVSAIGVWVASMVLSRVLRRVSATGVGLSIFTLVWLAASALGYAVFWYALSD